MERYIAFVLGRRWLAILLACTVMLALAAGGGGLTVSNNFRSTLSEDDPQLAAFDAFEATYSASSITLIAIAPREGSVFTRETLGAIEALTEAAWKVPHAIRVDSLTNYNHTEASGDDLIVAPLVEDARSLTDAELARIEGVARDADDLAGYLVSSDGRVAGLAISFATSADHDEVVFGATDHLMAVLDEAREASPDIDYYLSGYTMFERAQVDATNESFETLLPLAFVVMLGGAALLLRSVIGALPILFVIVFASASALGFAGWIGLALNPGTSGFPVIVMVVAVAGSIHIISTALAKMREGLDKEAAIAETLRQNAWPVFLTALTTTIGFLSLNSADKPFNELGNLVAFGVVCGFFYTMVLVPALLLLLPLRAPARRGDGPPFFARFGGFVVARRRPLCGLVVLVAVVLTAGIPRIELSEDFANRFDERSQFRRDMDFVTENLTGFDLLEYSLPSGREGGIADPDYLRDVDAFAEWLRAQPGVNYVRAFPGVMKRLNRNMHGDDPAFHRLPDDAELAAQYLLLYELSIPFGGDLNDRIDVAKSSTRMTAMMRGLTARDMLELDARAQDWLEANIPEFAGETTSMTMIFAHLAQRNVQGMLLGTTIGMALVSLILILALKSVRLGLVSLVPNFLPAAMAFGLWGFAVGRVGQSAAVVAVVAFGIIVDDTVHFMNKYRVHRGEGLAPPEAVRGAFRNVGPALGTTTAILVAGFLVLASSGYDAVRVLGLMVAITLAIALLVDFLLLPSLLIATERRKQ